MVCKCGKVSAEDSGKIVFCPECGELAFVDSNVEELRKKVRHGGDYSDLMSALVEDVAFANKIEWALPWHHFVAFVTEQGEVAVVDSVKARNMMYEVDESRQIKLEPRRVSRSLSQMYYCFLVADYLFMVGEDKFSWISLPFFVLDRDYKTSNGEGEEEFADGCKLAGAPVNVGNDVVVVPLKTPKGAVKLAVWQLHDHEWVQMSDILVRNGSVDDVENLFVQVCVPKSSSTVFVGIPGERTCCGWDMLSGEECVPISLGENKQVGPVILRSKGCGSWINVIGAEDANEIGDIYSVDGSFRYKARCSYTGTVSEVFSRGDNKVFRLPDKLISIDEYNSYEIDLHDKNVEGITQLIDNGLVGYIDLAHGDLQVVDKSGRPASFGGVLYDIPPHNFSPSSPMAYCQGLIWVTTGNYSNVVAAISLD